MRSPFAPAAFLLDRPLSGRGYGRRVLSRLTSAIRRVVPGTLRRDRWPPGGPVPEESTMHSPCL